jgi:hypothetical protein
MYRRMRVLHDQLSERYCRIDVDCEAWQGENLGCSPGRRGKLNLCPRRRVTVSLSTVEKHHPLIGSRRPTVQPGRREPRESRIPPRWARGHDRCLQAGIDHRRCGAVVGHAEDLGVDPAAVHRTSWVAGTCSKGIQRSRSPGFGEHPGKAAGRILGVRRSTSGAPGAESSGSSLGSASANSPSMSAHGWGRPAMEGLAHVG